ncbi:hypothetical protein HanHA300_Chr02g0043811 [Helianthus annuus]|nr:hypothetical protein HanHA300_Chr02g0043811 [Helianthus annuus]KAJ0617927.1 hypothetical protein HanHA89_Chr02g0047291 [Helianthus annuus]
MIIRIGPTSSMVVEVTFVEDLGREARLMRARSLFRIGFANVFMDAISSVMGAA